MSTKMLEKNTSESHLMMFLFIWNHSKRSWLPFLPYTSLSIKAVKETSNLFLNHTLAKYEIKQYVITHCSSTTISKFFCHYGDTRRHGLARYNGDPTSIYHIHFRLWHFNFYNTKLSNSFYSNIIMLMYIYGMYVFHEAYIY